MRELFGESEISINPTKTVIDESEAPVEIESKQAWSKEVIASMKSLAVDTWKAMSISETNPIYERIVGESFPDLSEQARNEISVRMRVCIQELATQEDPQMVQRITPEQFKNFASLYLIEKLG
jgi:hypothetical protein